MTMELKQFYPWDDARLDLVKSNTVTFLGTDYTYNKHVLAPAPIALTRSRRLSETEGEIETQEDPNPPDETFPTLTNPTGNATSATTAKGTVETDEADGLLWWVVSTDDTAPSDQEFRDGQNASGNEAADSGLHLIGVDGLQAVFAEGLSSKTTYYFHFLQRDEAGNGVVVSSASFTTP